MILCRDLSLTIMPNSYVRGGEDSTISQVPSQTIPCLPIPHNPLPGTPHDPVGSGPLQRLTLSPGCVWARTLYH